MAFLAVAFLAVAFLAAFLLAAFLLGEAFLAAFFFGDAFLAAFFLVDFLAAAFLGAAFFFFAIRVAPLMIVPSQSYDLFPLGTRTGEFAKREVRNDFANPLRSWPVTRRRATNWRSSRIIAARDRSTTNLSVSNTSS